MPVYNSQRESLVLFNSTSTVNEREAAHPSLKVGSGPELRDRSGSGTDS